MAVATTRPYSSEKILTPGIYPEQTICPSKKQDHCANCDTFLASYLERFHGVFGIVINVCVVLVRPEASQNLSEKLKYFLPSTAEF